MVVDGGVAGAAMEQLCGRRRVVPGPGRAAQRATPVRPLTHGATLLGEPDRLGPLRQGRLAGLVVLSPGPSGSRHPRSRRKARVVTW